MQKVIDGISFLNINLFLTNLFNIVIHSIIILRTYKLSNKKKKVYVSHAISQLSDKYNCDKITVIN